MGMLSDFLTLIKGTQTNIDGVLTGKNGRLESTDIDGASEDSLVTKEYVDATTEVIGYDTTVGCNYAKFASGLVIQWGHVGFALDNESSKEFDIPLAVPLKQAVFNQAFAAPVSTASEAYAWKIAISTTGENATSAHAYIWTGTGLPVTITGRQFQWLVIGHWK